MTALWMLYATLVTALLAAAAWTADRGLARAGRARRWVWVAAVAGGVGLPAVALWRAGRETAAGPAGTVLRDARAAGRRSTGADASASSPRAGGAGMPHDATSGDAVGRLIAAARGPLARLDAPLLALWSAASLAGALVLAHGAWALRRGRRAWRLMPHPAADVAGAVDAAAGPVWVAPGIGPAAVGVVRPAIVLPPWALALAPADLALVLAHERAHARARDPLLVALALGALVAAPWNAALWVAARRLRLAVEADCDGRVLCVHPGAARRYARLLVDVAERGLSGRGTTGVSGMAYAALLDPPGMLEWRVARLLAAARAGRPSPGRWRHAAPAVGLAAAGAALVVGAACAAPTPPAPTMPADARAVDTPRDGRVPNARVRDVANGRAAVAGDSLFDALDRVARALTERARAAGAMPADTGTVTSADTLAQLREQLARNAEQRARLRAQYEAVERQVERQRRARGDSLDGRRATRPDPRATVVRDEDGITTRSNLRALVAAHVPQALSGGLGPRPFVWLLIGPRGRVQRTATGPGGFWLAPADFMTRPARPTPDERTTDDGQLPVGRARVLDRGAVDRKFPGLTPDEVKTYGWISVPAGADTVQVIYATTTTDRP